MLTLDPAILREIRGTNDVDVLRRHLQGAIELEHSTIPPYLTALYSIKTGYNEAAARIIRTVVVQEMLHLCIVANVLNAIGGAPVVDSPGFIPVYPSPLPMTVAPTLTLGLRKLSRSLVFSTFMSIEEPETPIHYPVGAVRGYRQFHNTGNANRHRLVPRTTTIPARTIGARAPGSGRKVTRSTEHGKVSDFYKALIERIGVLGDAIFIGDPARQVVDPHGFPPGHVFAITDAASAIAGLELVSDQGAGSNDGPTERDGESLAHYYHFAEIVYGRRLIRTPDTAAGWTYGGDPVGIDPRGLYDLYPDAKSVDYPEGSQVRIQADLFNSIYTNLLRRLHRTFNGEPKGLGTALGLMFELRLAAKHLVTMSLPNSPWSAAPTFEYMPMAAPLQANPTPRLQPRGAHGLGRFTPPA